MKIRSPFLAIIPARGGSKGVPRKNVRMVAGKPLIQWSIEAARAATLYRPRVIVSSDDEEILDVAIGCGAEVLRRPAHLATDTARTDDVIAHVLNVLEVRDGYRPVLVALLQPTSPFRPSGLVDEAITRALSTGCHSLLTAHRLHFVWRKTGHNAAWETNCTPLDKRPRRQDMALREREWAENGSLYVFRPECVIEHDSRVWGRIEVLEIAERYGMEIDEEWQLAALEALMVLERGRVAA